jgi:hypothetical protein
MSANRLDEADSLIVRLRSVANMRVLKKSKARELNGIAAAAEARVLITPEEATTLHVVHGYPNTVIARLSTKFSQSIAGLPNPDKRMEAMYFSTPTMVAGCGDIEAATYLIARGHDFTAKDDLGMTPIEVAARMGDVEMVRYLIREVSADVADLDGLLCSLVVDLRADVCLSIVRMLCAAHDNVYDYLRLARGAAIKDHRDVMIEALEHYDLHKKFITESGLSDSILDALVRRFPHLVVAITDEGLW